MGEPNVCGFKIGDRVYWMIGEMHGVGNLDRGTVVDLHIDREMLVVVWDDDNYADPRSAVFPGDIHHLDAVSSLGEIVDV